MENLNIAQNIARLRKERKLTQEELADFCMVTKASVSKWEKAMSYPDICLLPKIAGFFDITIDALIGYQACLSREQISAYYEKWSKDCAIKPFEEIYEQTKQVIKNYYSCYPLLMEVAVLWLNHYMRVKEVTLQQQILGEIKNVCKRIYEQAQDSFLCTNAKKIESMVYLLENKPQEVIETYEPIFEKGDFLLEPNILLIQAYEMVGNIKKADRYNQMTTYMHLVNLVTYGIHDLFLHQADMERCNTTIQRLEAVCASYKMKELNTNLWLQFVYQKAVIYAANGQKEDAVEELNSFIEESIKFIKKGFEFHGDAYFEQIKDCFEQMKLATNAPRDERTVLESILSALEHPAFVGLQEEPKIQLGKKNLIHFLENFSSHTITK